MVGRKPCGCPAALLILLPGQEGAAERVLAAWERAGLTRETTTWVRASRLRLRGPVCEHYPAGSDENDATP